MKDLGFLADGKKIGVEISPLSGARVEQLVQNAFSTPPPHIIDPFEQATRTSG